MSEFIRTLVVDATFSPRRDGTKMNNKKLKEIQ